MEAKRFIGSDLTRLFARVERELGPDAVIVRTRTLLREGGPPLIEVVAAPGPGDADLELAAAVTDSIIQRVTAIDPGLTVGELEDIIARESAALAGEEQPVEAEPPRDEPGSGEGTPLPFPLELRAVDPEPPLAAQLRAAGLSEAAIETVRRLAEGACDAEEAVARALASLEARFPVEHETAVLTIVGGPGSGRTTALVRLALDCIDAGRPAVLASADRERAGALAQLRAYGDALGIAVIDCRDGRTLAKAMSRARPGTCFFVDTPASGWPEGPVDAPLYRYLAIPAHWQAEALEALVAPHASLPLAGTVITFADVATDLTPALSLALAAGAGIAFLSSGRDIASGVTEADPATLASGIRRNGSRERTDGRLAATA
ncbi:Signal recognition particle protein [bacterium HR29]|nr:Signal recognition particle protein [bacterium HR29]